MSRMCFLDYICSRTSMALESINVQVIWFGSWDTDDSTTKKVCMRSQCLVNLWWYILETKEFTQIKKKREIATNR